MLQSRVSRMVSAGAVAVVGVLFVLARSSGSDVLETSLSPVSDPGRWAAYRLLPDSSSVVIKTGSSGLLGFLGHEHRVVAPRFSGEAMVDTTDLTLIRLSISFPADSLRIDDGGRDADSRAKIEQKMKDDVLETGRYPVIVVHGGGFTIDGAESGAPVYGIHEGRLEVELDLHGVSRTLEVPVAVDVRPDRLRARGHFSITHADFSMERVKVAGVVNVAKKLDIDFEVLGIAAAAEP